MKNSQEKIFKITNIVLTIICLIILSILIYNIFKVNIIPMKYLFKGIIAFLIILFASFYIMYTNSKIIFKLLTYVLLITIFIFSFVLISYLKNTDNFLSSITKRENKLTYSLVVLKENGYERISDLRSKKIAYLEENSKNLTSKLNKLIEYNPIPTLKYSDLLNQLSLKKVDAIILENNYYNMLKSQISDLDVFTKIVYSYDINYDFSQEGNSNIDLTNETFIIYLNGVKNYLQENSFYGLNSLNELLIVNPKTHRILLVNNPKNLYLEINDSKDILSNIGLFGITNSKNALEKIYDIDIDNYLQIDLKDITNVIDVVGSIKVESNTEYTCDSNLQIKKGINYLNATNTLSYLQCFNDNTILSEEKIVLAILEKIVDKKHFPKKYNQIIKQLKNTFRTDLSSDSISDFLKNLIEDDSKWYIEYAILTGTTSNKPLYSLGDFESDVLEPSNNSIQEIKNKINNIINDK